MATSMDAENSILQNYISRLKSEDITKRLRTLKRTRDYLRDKRASSRIQQFREHGGLGILVKLLRGVVNDSSKLCTNVNAKVNVRIVTKSVGLAKSQVAQSAQYRQPSNTDVMPEPQRIEYLNMCISILATCCTEQGCMQKVKDSGCVNILGKILKNEKDDGVINRTSRAVANLARVPDLSAAFHRQEFIPCLTELLTKSEDRYTQYSLVRSFRYLADTPDHRLAIIDHGAIKAILGSLKSTEENLVAMAIETTKEMTQPHLFNHLKKPSWRALWETIGDQAEAAVAPILQLLETAKKSVADQALALLNNLMNSHSVRLAVGRCDMIPNFVKICNELEHANFLPYLQCLALCCKESVNRSKVKSSDGLDALLRVLQSTDLALQGKHVAVAGLVHFYHDDPALRYLCSKNLTGGLSKYLSDYVARDVDFPFTMSPRPVYITDKTDIASLLDRSGKCVAPDEVEGNNIGPILNFAAVDEKEDSSGHHHSETQSIPEIIQELASRSAKVVSPDPPTYCTKSTSSSADSQDASTPTKMADPSQLPLRSGGVEAKFFHTPVKEDITAGSTALSPLVPQNSSSPEDVSEDVDVIEEYSMFLDQSLATPYSPPRVDWSQVFACREQQGYRGLSPQSSTSYRSDSLERESPTYQYGLEWPLSPTSDGSWTMNEDTEGFDGDTPFQDYSPVVSEAEDQDEPGELEKEHAPQNTAEELLGKPSTSDSTSVMDPQEHSMSPSEDTVTDFQALLTSALPNQSPVKRARSPSIDSSYESETLDDVPMDDGSSKPEGYALHLLSKCSFMEETLAEVATFDVVAVLLRLALHSQQFRGRSTKILSRILGCRLAFESLVKEGVPQLIESSWERYHSEADHADRGSKLESEDRLETTSTACRGKREKRCRLDDDEDNTSKATTRCDVPDISDNVSGVGTITNVKLKNRLNPETAGTCQFLERLADVADSRFGRGVIGHLVYSSDVAEKMAGFDALTVLCRSRASLCSHVIEQDVVSAAVDMLQCKPSDENSSILISFLQRIYSSTFPSTDSKGSTKLSTDANSKLVNYEKGTGCGTDNSSSSDAIILSCLYQSSSRPMDLKISVDDGEFLLANRDILCQRSKYFSLMLEGSYKEALEDRIRICDVPKTVMEIILHHLYGCQWSVCDAFVGIGIRPGLELLSTSGKLLLPDLQEAVARSYIQQQVSADNVSAICMFAVDHGCAVLVRFCVRYMLGHQSVSSESFLELLNSSSVHTVLSEIRAIMEDMR